VWLVGVTASGDLPTRHALQPAHGGGGGEANGFLAAFSPELSTLCYGTYHGGSEGEQLEGVDVLRGGTVLVTGFSLSQELPAESLIDRTKRSSKLNGKNVNATVLAIRATNPCR
jgi:hypothetical protein